jgi:hypothetical protein
MCRLISVRGALDSGRRVPARPHPGAIRRRDRHLEDAADHNAVFEHGIVFRVVANRRAFEDQWRHGRQRSHWTRRYVTTRKTIAAMKILMSRRRSALTVAIACVRRFSAIGPGRKPLHCSCLRVLCDDYHRNVEKSPVCEPAHTPPASHHWWDVRKEAMSWPQHRSSR